MDNLSTFPCDDGIRDEALRWVVVFNRDQPPTSDEIKAVNEWASRSAAHTAELKRAEDRWCDMSQLIELAVPVNVPCDVASEMAVRRLPIFGFRQWGKMAAVASFFIATIMLLSLFQPDSSIGNGVYGTAVGELRLLTLEDGSKVHLDTASQAEVRFDEKTRRINLLQGKAHFSVAKNTERPFEVYVADGLVRAVGTAFSVYLKEDQDIEVLVDEGRVDLARVNQLSSSTPELISTPLGRDSDEIVPSTNTDDEVFRSLGEGQGIEFNSNEEVLKVLADEELEREQSWRSGLLIFAGEPLSQVVSEVSRYSPIRIEISSPDLGQLQVGGRFNVGDIGALFDVLESAFDVQVTYISKNHYQLYAHSD